MKKIIATLVIGILMTSATFAAGKKIGVTMARFDDNFLTVLRNGMMDYAKSKGIELQVEDAQDDVAKQLNQIQNFIASGVDAIIVNAVDTDATVAMSEAASKANIPLVYVNREPVNVDKLPKKQAFVASNEADSGTLQTKEVCRLLKAKGKGKGANIVVLMGQLSNQAARMRTKDIHDVIGTKDCSFKKIVEEQTGNWDRNQGNDLVTNWIAKGTKFDAIIANNDEMALGAIQALKAAGMSRKTTIVAGIDATQEALAAMAAGDLAVTVFQDAAGQGSGSVDTAVKIADGKKVNSKVYIPFQLVVPSNYKKFQSKN